jgi:hypothetical protein
VNPETTIKKSFIVHPVWRCFWEHVFGILKHARNLLQKCAKLPLQERGKFYDFLTGLKPVGRPPRK